MSGVIVAGLAFARLSLTPRIVGHDVIPPGERFDIPAERLDRHCPSGYQDDGWRISITGQHAMKRQIVANLDAAMLHAVNIGVAWYTNEVAWLEP